MNMQIRPNNPESKTKDDFGRLPIGLATARTSYINYDLVLTSLLSSTENAPITIRRSRQERRAIKV